MKKGAKARIVRYLENVGIWVSGKHIEEKMLEAGYKASYGAREARRLAELGLIKREERRGTVWYAHKEAQETKKEEYHIVIKDGVPVVQVR